VLIINGVLTYAAMARGTRREKTTWVEFEFGTQEIGKREFLAKVQKNTALSSLPSPPSRDSDS
jgi:hypothetical protein